MCLWHILAPSAVSTADIIPFARVHILSGAFYHIGKFYELPYMIKTGPAKLRPHIPLPFMHDFCAYTLTEFYLQSMQ